MCGRCLSSNGAHVVRFPLLLSMQDLGSRSKDLRASSAMPACSGGASQRNNPRWKGLCAVGGSLRGHGRLPVKRSSLADLSRNGRTKTVQGCDLNIRTSRRMIFDSSPANEGFTNKETRDFPARINEPTVAE